MKQKTTKSEKAPILYRPVEIDPKIQLMASTGFSYRAMRAETNLSSYEIAKQLRYLGIRLRHYRDATSPIGKHVVRKISYLADRHIVDHIERHLLK